jgi:acetylornithine deacetylase/succinyl-diaminopimelate desuccinylase-like protein
MRQLFAAPVLGRNIAAALALEGSGAGLLVDRALGSRRFRISVTGPGGHTWADAHAANPIFVLSEMVTAVAHIPLPATPRTALHCGTIHGGTAVNAVPERAEATLDLRSTSAAQIDLLTGEIHAIASRCRAAAGGVTVQLENIGDRPAAELPRSSPLLEAVEAIDRHLRIATDARCGSTDANWPLALGIPALALGAGGLGGGVHTAQEWYDPTGRGFALRRIVLATLSAAQIVAAQSFEKADLA